MRGLYGFTTADWRALFESIYPGFFDQPHIRAIPEGKIYEEMALDLLAFAPEERAVAAPEGVEFGFYTGDLEALRAVVRRVDPGWTELYDEKSRVYCAFAEGRVASFCLLENMTVFRGLRVCGPGCVGTLPEFRRRGIGLKMVHNVTAILREEGFDLGYIHYTGVAPWYARLGYETVLRWGRGGFVE